LIYVLRTSLAIHLRLAYRTEDRVYRRDFPQSGMKMCRTCIRSSAHDFVPGAQDIELPPTLRLHWPIGPAPATTLRPANDLKLAQLVLRPNCSRCRRMRHASRRWRPSRARLCSSMVTLCSKVCRLILRIHFYLRWIFSAHHVRIFHDACDAMKS
jgi:hypothetical protein